MDVSEFIGKWEKANLNEVAAFQTYFNDLCDLIGHAPPVTADPNGEAFKYEKFVIKPEGGSGYADVAYRGKFVWEQKSKGEDLDDAYHQALDYIQHLGNPPLIVVGDFEKIIIHTNFNNTEHTTYEVTLSELGKGLELIECLFHEPEKLKPPDVRSNLADKPRLSIEFEQVEPITIWSAFGLVSQYGGQAPTISGNTELEIILINSSYRTAKYITADLVTEVEILNRPEIHRYFEPHYRFTSTQDTYCLPDDEIVLGHLRLGITMTDDISPEFTELTQQIEKEIQQTEEEIRQIEEEIASGQIAGKARLFHLSMKLVKLKDTPSRRMPSGYDDVQRKLVSLYHRNPARDIYKLTFTVRAEGFATFEETKRFEIHWSNSSPQWFEQET